jgi:hypothetical protein
MELMELVTILRVSAMNLGALPLEAMALMGLQISAVRLELFILVRPALTAMVSAPVEASIKVLPVATVNQV